MSSHPVFLQYTQNLTYENSRQKLATVRSSRTVSPEKCIPIVLPRHAGKQTSTTHLCGGIPSLEFVMIGFLPGTGETISEMAEENFEG